MLKLRTSRGWLAAVVFLGLLLNQAAWATYSIPQANVGTGTVGVIDYAARTITVNGHAYHVSAKAAVTGAQNFEGLQAGMRVQFIMSGPVNKAASVITNVMVLPALPQAHP